MSMLIIENRDIDIFRVIINQVYYKQTETLVATDCIPILDAEKYLDILFFIKTKLL